MSASECYVDGVLCNPYLELMVAFRILRLSHTGVQFQPIDFCIYDSEAEGEFLRHPSWGTCVSNRIVSQLFSESVSEF